MDTAGAPKAASPKIIKNAKGNIVPSSQMAHIAYGCEHMGEMMENARKQTLQHYRLILHTIHEKPRIISQTYMSPIDGQPVVSLLPLYLCLQCPSIMTETDRDQHFETKSHCFSVESREAYIYCGNCQDFIYDPALEVIRLQKGKKRKHEDTTTADDHKLVVNNSTFLPCRAIGLRGLYNMGQTCFMSVILQTLVHNPFIRNFYLSEGHKTADCEREACVSCALDEMFVEFHSAEKTEGFGAVSMLMGSWLAGEALAGYNQQDAHEYMQFILNALHLANGGSSDSEDCTCIVHQTFCGQLSSTVTCDNCRNVTTAQDLYMDLSLDVKNQSKKRKLNAGNADETPLNIRDCLERFTAKEKLGSAEYTCRNCDSPQNAAKQLSIHRLPPVLSVHLKRFEHTKAQSSKIETKVVFPMKLDIYPYTTQYKEQAKATKGSDAPGLNHNGLIYELSTVIVHKGKMDSGHYVSYSREGGDWFLFDDSKVVLVGEAEVLAAEAYLLFYMISSLEV
ncbi:ubiquitin carboxyl-terminal hydrolase-like protein 22 [Dothidotthia symphoricarpi CBS 119687]|uniref:Ubiquitin carboxyl-terminal hydrolase-like protein 22 n=1 Tax=Dothidotthia symphoricarpi CBS 119687 TaxID=1392245 RepID=A0A6A6AFA3_9PLEO|nr:ubiquitin carboxyl-terminal hydrolase-like protein 22 [Dothidotthia symphoricarpi CBS 119687]KAF2129795.1 ubiquitin carboxyl-terminal hydrolase-like protein 22 [Dothidotthia symphoricarpi CBS 119687]